MPIFVCGVVRFFVMGSTLSRTAIVLLGFFIGTGVVIGLGLLWLMSGWPDQDPFD
jgi:hypothetical protein